ncbi:hypothetical protein V8E51_002825 [Hyaloscypha variabilis]
MYSVCSKVTRRTQAHFMPITPYRGVCCTVLWHGHPHIARVFLHKRSTTRRECQVMPQCRWPVVPEVASSPKGTRKVESHAMIHGPWRPDSFHGPTATPDRDCSSMRSPSRAIPAPALPPGWLAGWLVVDLLAGTVQSCGYESRDPERITDFAPAKLNLKLKPKPKPKPKPQGSNPPPLASSIDASVTSCRWRGSDELVELFE